MSELGEPIELLAHAAAGDQGALTELFSRHRKRLKQMIRLRINRRLQGRVDESDILQDAYLEAARRLPDYLTNRPLPFFLWLRHITGEKLIDSHRRHLGAKRRDAAREVPTPRGPTPEANSDLMAAWLMGRLTSPSQAAIKAETRLRVQEALGSLDPIDREILMLRHFEQLTNVECAETLGMNESSSSSRYLRALKRLKDELAEIQGLFGN